MQCKLYSFFFWMIPIIQGTRGVRCHTETGTHQSSHEVTLRGPGTSRERGGTLGPVPPKGRRTQIGLPSFRRKRKDTRQGNHRGCGPVRT